MPLERRRHGGTRIAAALGVALVAGASSCGSPPSTAPLVGVTIGHPASGELGAVVCTTTALHDCAATMPFRRETLVFPTLDVEAAASCASLEADARRHCTGAPSDPATLRCLAERGVFLGSFATSAAPDPSVPSARFVLRCHEGETHIDVIEPF